MPHAAISMLTGRSTQTKERLAKEIQKVLASELGVKPDLVSVSIADIDESKWKAHLAQFESDMYIYPEFMNRNKEKAKPGPVAKLEPQENILKAVSFASIQPIRRDFPLRKVKVHLNKKNTQEMEFKSPKY